MKQKSKPFIIYAYRLRVWLAWLLLALTGFSLAEEPVPVLRAGVFVDPPFVMREGDSFRGMSIDIWEKTAEALGYQTRYLEYSNLPQLLQDARTEAIDVVVTNLMPTHARAQTLAFSFPWYDAGARVMIRRDATGQVWEQLREHGQLRAYAGIFLLLIALSVGMTLFRRRLNPEFPCGWIDGLSQSFCDLVIVAKSGRLDVRKIGWVGNLLTAIWMLFGVALVAYVTSTVTATMTAVSIRSDIASVADLPGKRVATLTGSFAGDFLNRMGVMHEKYDNMTLATAALLENHVDALFSDAPVLEYWAHTHPEQKLHVVGGLVHPGKYSFATGLRNGDLMDRVSVELIRLHEMGAIQEIRAVYFGGIQL